MSYIREISALGRNDLTIAGGKGANLGEMLQAGLPVPPGFCILTPAYRAFVSANDLGAEIQRQIGLIESEHLSDLTFPVSPINGNIESLEAASGVIRAQFAGGSIPADLAQEIVQAYRDLAGDATPLLSIAVRSSATAEDLPDLSFAGQQDTFLNIVGAQALLEAVVKCWSSLWTARALGYRARAGIDHSEVALAVVVQRMIPSEAAGVLFTVNPLTGRRSETVIDATVGLGEALVAGMVEPDHYMVEEGRIKVKTIGAKTLSVRSLAGGGTVTVTEAAAQRQALPDDAILALAQLGRQSEVHFGCPQDVEWSWTSTGLWLVQSRPITSLFPIPTHQRGPKHLLVLVNFGAVQGVMDPITPIGRDLFFNLVPSMAAVFGSGWTIQTQTLVYEAAERLFFDFNGALRHPVGSRVARVFLPAIEPGSVETLEAYRTDPRLSIREVHWGLGTRLKLASVLLPNAVQILINLLFPGFRRRQIQARIERVILSVQVERKRMVTDPASAVDFYEHTLSTMPQRMIPWLVTSVATGQVAFQGLRRLVTDLPEGDRLALEVVRGLPNNVTTEMDLALWSAAQAIRSDAISADVFGARTAVDLAKDFSLERLPGVAQQAVSNFLMVYGVRGVGEIDLGRIRWREDPTPVMQSLKSYLQIDRPDAAPDVVFARGAEAAQRAITQLIALIKNTRGGWWKAALVGWLAHRARELAGLRESPKLTIIRIFGEIRAALLIAGENWAAGGWLRTPADIAYLRIADLKLLAVEAGQQNPAATDKQKWINLVGERRSIYERERRRRQSPRLVMGDGTTVYEGVGGKPLPGEKVLLGSPVSPGQVEGIVHVVLDPFGANLVPGEILVCPGTDPAWTPLFLTAGGLVMEVGGLMTHGSVVAREYGIPAVVGVGQATLRLTTGTRIRVDGSAGTITLLD